jgi:hypothetical protein
VREAWWRPSHSSAVVSIRAFPGADQDLFMGKELEGFLCVSNPEAVQFQLMVDAADA